MDKVRIGVVAGGWISQAAFMPGVAHTGNTVLTALVTGDPQKARALADKYDIAHTYDYSEFGAMLDAGVVDALYIATPNWMHREYAVPALTKGVHVLLEKPMEVSEDACIAIADAAKASTAKLMIAYRLHFEPATIEALQLVRAGELGDIRLFASVFTQQVSRENHRAHNGYWAGPVADMGPYPINTARNVFGCEPIEVVAVGARNPAFGYDFDDQVCITLTFPEQRMAHIAVGYGVQHIDQYRIVGTHGELEVNPGYAVNGAFAHVLNGEKKHKYAATDQFGGELKYFSDCILSGRDPEPDASEGLADVRVIAAVESALLTHVPQAITPTHRDKRIEASQVEKLRKVREPELVNAAAPNA